MVNSEAQFRTWLLCESRLTDVVVSSVMVYALTTTPTTIFLRAPLTHLYDHVRQTSDT